MSEHKDLMLRLDAALDERDALKTEMERLRDELQAAGDGDTWREACGRCEKEIARLLEVNRKYHDALMRIGHDSPKMGDPGELPRYIAQDALREARRTNADSPAAK